MPSSRPLIAVTAAVGLLVLAWASVAGPVTLLGSTGPRREPQPSPPSPSASPSPDVGLPPSGRELFGDRPQRLDLSWIGDLLSWTVLLGAIAAMALGLRLLWQHRGPRRSDQDEDDFDVLPTVSAAAEAISRDAEARLNALSEGTPTDGIISCWLRLERVVAEAGFPRERWETSAEFTVRVLKALDVDPASVAMLAELYREARFSAHPPDERARTKARAALRRFEAELVEVDR